jgi:peptidoglycan/xylan/chitin deacetylase (PgdA/CDA1 family)
MLNVQRFTIVYFTLLYLLFRLTTIHYLVLLAAALVYLGVMIYGSFYIGSNFYLKPILSVKTGEKKIALTFDDGPDETITPVILDTLGKWNIRAAFFCVGRKISANPALLKKIDEREHLIGNHTHSHSNWFGFYSAKRMMNELKETDELIQQIVNRKVRFFRPPFGVTNPAMEKAVRKCNYVTIGWNIRSLDTPKRKKTEQIVSRIIRKIKPGSIILLHDKNPNIGTVLEKLLEHTAKTGYEVVRLDELIKEEAYA